MNTCIFIGRIASDPEIRETKGGVNNCAFRLAVQRRYKDANGERQADFIQCIAWRQTAEFIHKFIHKGDCVGVRGSMQNRSYQTQDGTTRYVSEIIVDEIKTCGSAQGKSDQGGADFVPVDDDNLPF